MLQSNANFHLTRFCLLHGESVPNSVSSRARSRICDQVIVSRKVVAKSKGWKKRLQFPNDHEVREQGAKLFQVPYPPKLKLRFIPLFAIFPVLFLGNLIERVRILKLSNLSFRPSRGKVISNFYFFRSSNFRRSTSFSPFEVLRC